MLKYRVSNIKSAIKSLDNIDFGLIVPPRRFTVANISTVEISKEKLIELLTPILKDNGALSDKEKITDFMYCPNADETFGSIQVVMVHKNTKTTPMKKHLKFTWKYVVPKKPKNARWEQELFRTIYTVCVKASNELGYKDKPEFLEADAMTIACLQSMEQFELEEGNHAPTRIGHLGRFNVHRNLESLSNYIFIRGVNGDARIELDFSKMPKAKMK